MAIIPFSYLFNHFPQSRNEILIINNLSHAFSITLQDIKHMFMMIIVVRNGILFAGADMGAIVTQNIPDISKRHVIRIIHCLNQSINTFTSKNL